MANGHAAAGSTAEAADQGKVIVWAASWRLAD